MTSKTCAKCGESKPTTDFFKDCSRRDGLSSRCKPCKNASNKDYRDANLEKVKAKQLEWHKANRDTQLKKMREYCRANREALKDYRAQYYTNNKERFSERSAKWREKQGPEALAKRSRAYYERKSEQIQERVREYRKANPHKVNAFRRQYEDKLRKATPPWADMRAIRALYEQATLLTQATGIKHHVDHVHPLQGKTFSGLHVHYNLAVVTAEENLRKSNKPTPQVKQLLDGVVLAASENTHE